ncbi:hypothetical protein AVEN_139195-1 [Araneus ventricosus]|uniref:Uncharacterized protein n=1 Tax=Araneus ventricosus TaxID=182803 RepID=A0A4Y2N4J6_ARAVE|nr:hypothetical protein AVEN_139195-1 [Araneus ventricosus]
MVVCQVCRLPGEQFLPSCCSKSPHRLVAVLSFGGRSRMGGSGPMVGVEADHESCGTSLRISCLTWRLSFPTKCNLGRDLAPCPKWVCWSGSNIFVKIHLMSWPPLTGS